ncbi:hypothetical protein T4D_936 [Trichinella pseudospiralis]|uniref:Uncharacterized protein n=1 Tax=Trichinella pseudospiralis TaxID=6337 RepID=A0A0V1F523_TRIPS|nr:hypothetical protein T4D_936 [Trichinella pseudospiralis]
MAVERRKEKKSDALKTKRVDFNGTLVYLEKTALVPNTVFNLLSSDNALQKSAESEEIVREEIMESCCRKTRTVPVKIVEIVEKHAERYKMEVDLLKKNGICMLAHDQTLRWGRKVVEDKMAPYL